MKNKIKLTLALLIGAVLGGVGMFLYGGVATKKIMALYAQAVLTETAVDARQLRKDRADEVLKRKEVALPEMIRTFEKYHRCDLPAEQGNGALWAVQRYYAENPGISAPSDIKVILDALPPRPLTQCEKEAACTTQSNPAGQ
ncbi:MAG TPA: hypothetical protein DCX07_03940 [Phycisphaerales bacterium]|nr:hypothetical protein [Phycisphaerales bacterium]